MDLFGTIQDYYKIIINVKKDILEELHKPIC